jgi:hypothetical protein
MDTRQIRDKALVELLYKAESLCYNEVLGTPTKYCWDDLLMKYQAIKVIDDSAAEEDTQQCAAAWLNERIDQRIVSIQSATLDRMYIPLYGQPYRGTISSASQMAIIDAQPKVEGWWWSITGVFTYDGTSYAPGDEIFWNRYGFNFLGKGGGIDTAITNLTVSGTTIYKVAAETLAFGDMCKIGTNSRLYLAKADEIANASALYMCGQSTVAPLATGLFLIQGIARNDSWDWTVGGLVFLSTVGTSGNTLTQTVPTGTDNVVQVVGVASRSNEITVSPNLLQVEHV